MYFLLPLSIFIVLGVLIIVFIVRIFLYAYAYLFWGAIYVAISKEKTEKMLSLLKLKPGQKVVDLGSGDGRLLVAVSQAGAVAYGYEINPLLVSLTKKNIKKAGLEGKAFVYCKNLWQQDLSGFDAVVIYPMAHMMAGLEKKFEKELKPGAKIVSKHFTLPTWKPERMEEDIYLYIKK